jgi:hypothetical protein
MYKHTQDLEFEDAAWLRDEIHRVSRAGVDRLRIRRMICLRCTADKRGARTVNLQSEPSNRDIQLSGVAKYAILSAAIGADKIQPCVTKADQPEQHYTPTTHKSLQGRIKSIRKDQIPSGRVYPGRRESDATAVPARDQHLASEKERGGVEPPRLFRRLQLLRGWSHEDINEVFPRGA